MRYVILVSSFFSLLLFTRSVVVAQDNEKADSAIVLKEIAVTAFRYNKPLLEVPVAVALIGTKDLERFSNTNLLPAMNAVPGVRMEERSPGSYRFSIRGSLLRSPFGVRNVKMYWNGLPLTDGGGNTYFNLLDFQSPSGMEIIKGPGGSLYGAGTGGVVLLSSAASSASPLRISSTFGSYGLRRFQVAYDFGQSNVKGRIQYAHQEADGYRLHSAMRRDVVNTDLMFSLSPKNTLALTLLYTDLYYQTPGGLNRAQYDTIPRQARQNADALKAAIRNKTGYAGVMLDHQWNDSWSTRLGFYGSVTAFENPTFLNYEARDEQNWGMRMENQFSFGEGTWSGKVTFGEEFQGFYSPIKVNSNVDGSPGPALLSDDKLRSQQLILFAQAEIALPWDLFFTAGLSNTLLQYKFKQIDPDPASQKRNFDPVISPRAALLKKITRNLSVYSSVSHGFSPPSLAEVRPSTNTYNNTLKPEKGISYEGGLKGNLSGGKLTFSVAAYHFGLDETIIIQRTPDGADYFINAGHTVQRGLEVVVSWDVVRETGDHPGAVTLWTSYTHNHYKFRNYVVEENDYSGNALTGVAPEIVVGGIDVSLRSGFYMNATANWTDAIPLNDANDVYASDYFLLGARFGYKKSWTSSRGINIFAGIDNALDNHYSLGNDLNARGGRYFNAAAPRNYYAGFTFAPFAKRP